MIGVVVVLVARRNLVHSQAEHLDEGVLGMGRTPSIFEAILLGADDVEAIVRFPQEKKTRI
jgi:hypothetical protein